MATHKQNPEPPAFCHRVSVREEIQYRHLAVGVIERNNPKISYFIQGIEQCGDEVVVYHQLYREGLQPDNVVAFNLTSGAITYERGE